MNKRVVTRSVTAAIKQALHDEGSGHDWWHIERVRKYAQAIGKAEHADAFIVELGALLHDIADHKFHNGDHVVGPLRARTILSECGADQATIDAVCHIVGNVSYAKGVGGQNPMQSLEGWVVQDADRLDALGAIGIARAFAYGGFRNQPLYDPVGRVRTGLTNRSYLRGHAASTLHHFYEKILLLADRMNTRTGKKLAKRRDRYVRAFLDEFLLEWDGLR